MILNKQSLIYLILIIFSVFFTGIKATDCDVYKDIIGNQYPYKDDLDKMNGNCCRMEDRLKCDAQNNIIFVTFYVQPCNYDILFEKLANLPKLQEIEISIMDGPIPSTIGKPTQIKKLNLRYTYGMKTRYQIPDEIGNLINLEELILTDSNLDGKIPNTIGNLVNLKKLDLSSNHFEGYVPYEFKNLKNLKNLNLSGNILKGFVPPISTLSNCNVEFNEGMCYLKSSKCRSGLKECTLDEIKTANNNNNNPNPSSGEFENEKEVTEISKNVDDDDDKKDIDNDGNNIDNDGNNIDNDGKPKNIYNFFKPFFIVIGSGIVIIAIVFLVIYKKGKKTPKFNKFDDENDATTQPTTYSYEYRPASVPTTPTAPTSPPVTLPPTAQAYYSGPSPVPPAAQQPLPYIPPSPSTPYSSQMAYGNPVQPPPQRSPYIPPSSNIPNAYPPQEAQTSTSNYTTYIPPPSTDSKKSAYPPPQSQQSPNDTLPLYEKINRTDKHLL